ncbi:hypothetical protein NS226_15300 [Aureimonas ureilytica]|uniref:Integrase n=2 Tax=Aureimonas ureilytica TaxID=401562 RepID=A0A175R5L5_9HYPH|nr:hypothetical protein NS226_15300 [Aureimonas ureilytica]
MASVSKREWDHNGETKTAWVVRYTDNDGKRRLKTFDKKKDADKYRTQVEVEVGNGLHKAPSQTVTFGFAADEYMKDCERRWRIKDRMAGNTLRHYAASMRANVRPAFASMLLTDLTAAKIQAFINEDSERLAWRTVNIHLILIRNVIQFALDRDWLAVSPLAARKVRLPKADDGRRSIPTKDEIRSILEVIAGGRQRGEQRNSYRVRVASVLIAIFAGLRRGEICGLQWENVDLENGYLHVRHSLSIYDGLKTPKTKAGVRSVPMAKPVRGILELLKKEAGGNPTGFVLQTRNGTPINPNDIYTHWRAVMKAAGLTSGENDTPKYTFHDLRHTAVSLLIEQGLDAMRLKDIIGHGSVTMTMDVYGHLFPDDNRARNAITAASAQFDLVAVGSRQGFLNRDERRQIAREARQERDTAI